jgi:hypothetical protein
MVDISKLPDDELKALHLQQMPDEQLTALYNQNQPADTSMAAAPLYPTAASAQALDRDFENQLLAARQRTTPIMTAHAPNLVSSDVFMNDQGELQYKDPDTGKVVDTNAEKHVVLRDPDSGELKVFNRTPETDEGRISALGRIVSLGTNTRTLPALASVPEVATAAAKIGVELPRATTSETLGRAGKIVAGMPFGAPLVRKSQEAIGQLENAVTDTAKAAGGATEPAVTGEAVQNAITKTIPDATRRALGSLYGEVEKLVDPNAMTSLPSTATAVNNIVARRTAAALPTESTAVKAVMEGVTRPEGMTFEGIKDLRTNVGDLMKEEAIAGRPTDGLNSIYASLSDDLRASALHGGGAQAVNAFDRANYATSVTKQWQEQLEKIVGPASRSSEGVTGVIKRMAGVGPGADIQTLTLARRWLPPEAWENVASTIINQLGRDRSGTFSPTRFVSDYAQISPQAKQVLFNGVSQKNLLDTLENANIVADRSFKRLDQFANTSRTAGHTAAGVLGAGTGIEILERLMHGSPGEAAIAAASLAGTGAANNALARVLAATPKALVPSRGPGVAVPATMGIDVVNRPIGAQPAPTSNLAKAIGAGYRELFPPQQAAVPAPQVAVPLR